MTVQTSKKAQAELRRRKDDLETIRKRDLAVIMGLPEGRRFVYDLIDRRCKVFSQSYVGTDETLVNEGMRIVGIKLMHDVQEDHLDKYMLMLSEQISMAQQDRLVEESAKAVAKEDPES